MANAAKVSIDASGRLVVPKQVRDEAGLRPGIELEIRYRDGRVEIEPAPRDVRLVRRGKVLVAEAQAPSEALTQEIVRETRDALRSRKDGA